MDHHPEEFIGQELKVRKAANKSLEGLEGTIIDETKKTFTIRTRASDEKVIFKELCDFEIAGNEIKGKDLALRPEERVKSRK
ncbi:ribonuclease P protein subunit [Candidatus Woesearchaeota archaeon]|nr:ribonuclease P protein subunit [Candidatus Woesearchaeota archaeon]